ncbi:unnamed protein product [Colletotrichum noveboracense]|uniref:Peptidase S33 tripeptidyl aminopeptidase-like C-terminal domain-containing protein n=1 Tax=Colletotrichum noveboracense TaxID=2664923 RepID=A0A9W4RW32_9PEZI|nr:hypothetical protein K456DRAFT_46752 [Colletotrichum gloeosporioides 23]CAI0648426.1 unnamed protein product [Colletotrichum noveboracense]
MSAKSFTDSNLPLQPAHPSPRQQWRRPLVFGILLFVVWTWKLHEVFFDRNAVLHSSPQPFHVYTDWDDVPTSEKLHWVRCILPGMTGDRYLCARLTVPMDYQRPLNQSSDNPKVHVAMVLLPAPGHGIDTGRFSESPLVLNPGGPGGVGTAFVYPPRGPTIQAIAGGDIDLLGFDPRGIGATVPRGDCFIEGDTTSAMAKRFAQMRRMTWMLSVHDVGLPNETNEALDALAHRARAVSKLCSRKDGEDSAFRYMGTPNVAADIKSIVEAHDDWLDENGFETVSHGARLRSPSEAAPPSTKRKLVYWGFSYGTFIGQTFAAMYPNSVGRLILDGVVDTRVYDEPTWWVSTMRDSDAIVDKFFYYCHLAGERCYFFRKGDTADDIKTRYDKVMAKLRADPVTVIPSYTTIPVILMESDIKKTIFQALYAPMMLFPLIADLLNRVYIEADLSNYVNAGDLIPMCSPEFQMPPALDVSEAQAAISCSDQRVKRNDTLEGVFKRTSEYTSFADVLMSIMMSCEGWDIEARFPSPDWDANLHSPDPVNTSFPILFVGNTHDPVTPLGSAVDMSQNFVNAGVFELQTEGHCTLASVSVCAVTKIRDYLQKGVVPPHPAVAADGTLSGWDKCKSDEWPWKPFTANAAMHAEDLHVLQAFRDVHAEITRLLTPPTKVHLHDM